MRLVAALLFLPLAAMPLSACGSVSLNDMSGTVVPSSGSGGQRSFAADGFTRIELRGADDVDVRTGPSFAVRAEGDPAVLDKIEVRKDGDTLRIGRKGQFNWSDGGGRARVFVVLPRLVGASIAGSGDMNVERADGDFSGSIAGSGNLRVARLSGGKADLSIAGSGNLSIAGTADALHSAIAGSGDVDAAGLRAATADISTAGSGSTRATVSGPAKISIIGSGDVTVRGGAQCTISKVGSGEADCG